VKPLVLVAVALVMGCSVPSKDIPGEYVSPSRYRAYNCEQLASESARVHTRETQIAAIVDRFAQHDPPLNGLPFWPEYTRLKGERAALQQAAFASACSTTTPVRMNSPPPSSVITP
jgi:hypothetical protein